jgi:dienelactone hydrolase
MTTHRLATSDEHPVTVDVYTERPGPERVVVLCHGFKGHRRWGFIPRLARRLAGEGICAVAMDFSLGGRAADEPSAPFRSPDLFRRNTIARERSDLGCVVDWVRRGCGGATAPGATLGLWGHSRGGVAAMLWALDDPGVAALVTWATAAHPDFYTDRQKARWREEGAYEFTDAETGTPLALGIDYLEDLERHSAEYALADRAPGLTAAHLVVHGEHDLVIPVGDARLLAAAGSRSDKQLLVLPTGHTFGYEKGAPGGALERAEAATVDWFVLDRAKRGKR